MVQQGEVVSATSAGVYAFHDDGGGLINVRKVTSGAEGVVANSYNGGFTINAGSILAVGVGIDAFSVGSGNLVVTSTDRIETTGVGSSGLTAATSGDILRAALEVLDAGPDLLVLYHGVNDIGRLETLAALQAFSPWQLSLRVFLDESRLARVITDLLPDSIWEQGYDGSTTIVVSNRDS